MDTTLSMINTCLATTSSSRVIAYYSHIIPIVIGLSLAFLIFYKVKHSLLSRIFLSFVFCFSLWLLGDLIVWTSNNYHLVYALWAPLDYIEIVFYVLGLYFSIHFITGHRVPIILKILFFLVTLPALYITLTQQSVIGFNYPVCEALNNDFLTLYKLIIEVLILVIIAGLIIKQLLVNALTSIKRKSHLIVLGSLFLFLLVFGGTEYLASVTAYYEMNLYGMFVLPVFLFAIIYAVFNLDIFNVHILGTQYLVIGLLVLIISQLFFINSATDQLLTGLTVLFGAGLGVIMFRNLKRESDQRIRIEKLSAELGESNTKLEDANEKLKGLDKLKTEFLSLASHQLRSPLTAIKGYASMVLEGDYGKINDKAKEAVDRIFQSSQNLAIVVEDLLNVSKIEQGGMKYEMAVFPLSEIAKQMATDLSITAEKRGLKLSYSGDDEKECMVNGDKEKLRQVVLNFIDNSIKYTKTGTIDVSVRKNGDKVVFAVKDTGMGMTPEIKASLFQKFARGDGARMNTTGSGLGLYLAKEIVEAHKGRVWVDSDGPGKGSTFAMELSAVK